MTPPPWEQVTPVKEAEVAPEDPMQGYQEDGKEAASSLLLL